MGVGPVQAAAFVRAAWLFLGTLVVTAITTYFGIGSLVEGPLSAAGISEQDRLLYAIGMGVIAAFSAFGIRAGGEGRYDTRRAETNNINAGDVPVAAPNVTVTEPAKP